MEIFSWEGLVLILFGVFLGLVLSKMGDRLLGESPGEEVDDLLADFNFGSVGGDVIKGDAIRGDKIEADVVHTVTDRLSDKLTQDQDQAGTVSVSDDAEELENDDVNPV